jgi:hypothetical protein
MVPSSEMYLVIQFHFEFPQKYLDMTHNPQRRLSILPLLKNVNEPSMYSIYIPCMGKF